MTSEHQRARKWQRWSQTLCEVLRHILICDLSCWFEQWCQTTLDLCLENLCIRSSCGQFYILNKEIFFTTPLCCSVQPHVQQYGLITHMYSLWAECTAAALL